MSAKTVAHSSSLKSKYLRNFEKISLPKEAVESSESSDDETADRPTFVIDSKPNFGEVPDCTAPKPKQSVALSSVLDPGIDLANTYVSTRPRDDPSEPSQKLKELALATSGDELLRGSVLTPGFEKKDAVPPYTESLKRLKAQRRKERSLTKGPGWFGMPAPELTEDLKRDLQVLRMRRVLDPKRFYKKNDLKDLPKYFQVGTVMDSPTDFYHARVPKKDRKQTLVEELLADAQFRSFNKKKYQEAMAKQQRVSKKALKHMKRLKKRK